MKREKKKTKSLSKRVKIALVGCGRISKNHFKAISENQDWLELSAVCDNNSENLTRAIKETGVSGFSSLEELLAEDDSEIITLTTPSGMHSKQSIRIAQSKRHVITEKPMATRWKDGIDMVSACDEAGVNLFVVKQNRMNKTLQSLKNAIVSGRFGRIYMVNVNVFWTRPQEYYDSGDWRGTWEFDGGALMNQASHYVDLLDWLIGPVESVQAYTSTLARNIEVEDTAVMQVKWRSGALGSLNVTMLTYPKNFEGSVTIIGEKGTARIGGIALNEVQEWGFSEKHQDDDLIKENSYQTGSVYGFGHSLYYKNVREVLLNGIEPETDGREGLRSLELLVAAYQSARYGRRVALPLEV